MSASSDQTEQTYKVGYQRPPKAHQFQPGQSGNPKGRPRGSRNKLLKGRALGAFEAMLEDELKRSIPIKERGTQSELSAGRAIMRSVVASAVRGNVGAQKLALELMRYSEQKADQEKANVLRLFQRYIYECDLEKKSCEEQGIAFDPDGPLPKAISFDPETGAVTVKGPMSRAEREEQKVLLDQIASHVSEVEARIASGRDDPAGDDNRLTNEERLEQMIKAKDRIAEINSPHVVTPEMCKFMGLLES